MKNLKKIVKKTWVVLTSSKSLLSIKNLKPGVTKTTISEIKNKEFQGLFSTNLLLLDQ